ncbi:hypothetical protein [Hahella chejuensis]|uniref:hypothetical protein n=1 Tax=Hahella chejuensis TaxID=158327 RepID=UPI0011D0F74D|nr:hypothetical protein [Hahella chejuensis]
MDVSKELVEIADMYLAGKKSAAELLAVIATDIDQDRISLGKISFTPASTNFDSGSLFFRTKESTFIVEHLKLALTPKTTLSLSDLNKYWGEFRKVPTGPDRLRHNYAFLKVLKPEYQYSGYINVRLSAPVDTPDSKVVTIMIRRDPISKA